MNERMKFIIRLKQNNERMSDLCNEFGISRKTGYKILKRFESDGPSGLEDCSRRAIRNGKETNTVVQKLILDLKGKYPTWGAPKLRESLSRHYPDHKLPAISTVHAILDRHGLVKKRKGRRFRAEGTNLKPSKNPNDLWCTDFKGQFKLLNHQYCFPLTVSDHCSRYILGCDALESYKEEDSFPVFVQLFKEFGLPDAMRTDNGSPFSSRAIFGLSRLSVWWLRLGIKLERIEPGHPEQNGRHERMHRTLKEDIKLNRAKNFLQQQEYFDKFVEEFNNKRPHEALQMKMPSDLYQKSVRQFPEEIPEYIYDESEHTAWVSHCGTFAIKGMRVFLSEALGGQQIGISYLEDQTWSVQFLDYELGFFDEVSKKFTPGENPFKLGGFLPTKKV